VQTACVSPANASNVRVTHNAMTIATDLAAGDDRVQILREGIPLFTADYAGIDLASVNPPSYVVTDFPPALQVATGQVRYTFAIQRTAGAGGTVQGAFFSGSAAAGNFTG